MNTSFLILILLLLTTCTLQQNNCTFTFDSPSKKIIQRNFQKLKVVRITIPDHNEYAIPFEDYHIVQSTQLFLLRPSFNYQTAGLFSKSFYVTKPNVTGKICDSENRSELQNNDWFMSYILKNVIFFFF
jgi:hypothetical protein